MKKLEKRYPGGQFDVYYSENREVGRPVINLEYRRDAMSSSSVLGGFFSDEGIKIREISNQLDKQIGEQ